MSSVEAIAVLALVISTFNFLIELFRMLHSGPRISLSVIGDARGRSVEDGKATLAITVFNGGGAPTIITNMLVFTYDSYWKYLRDKPTMFAVVNCPRTPFELEPKKSFTGYMVYNDRTKAARNADQLYVGVASSHSSKCSKVKVPPAGASRLEHAERIEPV